MGRPERTLSQAVLSATFWNTLLLPARLLVGVVASVIYYQELPREHVGLVFFLTSLAATLGLYADLGIERSLPRFLPEAEAGAGRRGVLTLIRRVIRVKLLVLLPLILALYAFAAPLSRLLAEKQREQAARLEQRAALTTDSAGGEAGALRQQAEAARALAGQIESRGTLFLAAVAALLLLGALFDVGMQFLTAYFKQRAWNLITLATTLLQPVLVTLFLLAGWGIDGVLIGIVATPVVSVALAAWQARRAAQELVLDPLERPLEPGLLRRFTRFAAVTYLTQLTTWLYDLEFVVFLSAASLGLGEVALLGFAYKFARDFIGYVWTPMTGVMTPLLTRIKGRHSPKALEEAHASLTRMIWLLMLPAGVGLAVLAPRLVRALYPNYTASTTLVLVFIAFTFAESLLSVPQNVLMVYEQLDAVILSRLVAFLSLPLAAILWPRYGPMGLALAVGLARVLSRLVALVYGVRRLRLTLPLRFGLRVAGASATLAATLRVLLRLAPSGPPSPGAAGKIEALLPLAGLAILGALVYALALRLLGGLDEAERRRLLTLPLPAKELLRRLL